MDAPNTLPDQEHESNNLLAFELVKLVHTSTTLSLEPYQTLTFGSIDGNNFKTNFALQTPFRTETVIES
jgi:hypothetical protein